MTLPVRVVLGDGWSLAQRFGLRMVAETVVIVLAVDFAFITLFRQELGYGPQAVDSDLHDVRLVYVFELARSYLPMLISVTQTRRIAQALLGAGNVPPTPVLPVPQIIFLGIVAALTVIAYVDFGPQAQLPVGLSLFVVGLVVAIYLSCLVPTGVFEAAGWAAASRSMRLVHGHFWQVLAAVVLASLPLMLLGILIYGSTMDQQINAPLHPVIWPLQATLEAALMVVAALINIALYRGLTGELDDTVAVFE